MEKDRRLELQRLLSNCAGTKNVYFQPPENLQIYYPAVIYELENVAKLDADNLIYGTRRSYRITYVTRDADDPVIDKLAKLPRSRFVRFFASEGLNHYVYEIVY